MSKIRIDPFYHQDSQSISYVVTDLASRQSAVIDPVLDFDISSGKITTEFADSIIEHLDKNGYELEWILETHAHCDHISAACYIKQQRGGNTGIGEHIVKVQHMFKRILNLGDNFHCNGEQFDQLFADEELIKLGHLDVQVMHTPGHTPACVSYLIEDAIFVGDVIASPDVGTVNLDFPNCSVTTLYQSIQKILALPNSTRVFVGHNPHLTHAQNPMYETSIIAQKRTNKVVGGKVDLQEFVKLHQQQHNDATMPQLLLPAIQLNIRAGHLPPPEGEDNYFLKIPVNQW
ncbi:MBL fold metallo-hydrolase [Shewanella saliphila]|uniref:Metallo-beta-lactamase domain-containing protein n=1 Tax=Shewanella saliphila TaxID=2282698 RepID=A0ABQ2Q093_9GAMM|nr:MBL fold metallo-hydrolase [Shewanella saliphila]MCL1100339.1 MBL fold metallo-hydrolase [Shewanella saliphila]GGP37742.1 hypothetical protein GCM10009409_00730 [Shewanella saliphila]